MSLDRPDKELPDKQLTKNGKARKFRRSHKNSRDGCPNCRAKRVKCTEELPSCSNCVRKNLRCGYLDFPAERLDHIRRKNEMTMNQGAGDLMNYENNPSSDFMQSSLSLQSENQKGELDQESDSLTQLMLDYGNFSDTVNSKSSTKNHIRPSMEPKIHFKKRKSVVVKPETRPGLPKAPSVRDFRSVVYSNALNRKLRNDKDESLWNIPDSVFSDSVFFTDIDTQDLKEPFLFPLSYEPLEPEGSMSILNNLPDVIKREMSEMAPRHSVSFPTLDNTLKSKIIGNQSICESSSNRKRDITHSLVGAPLPRASHNRTVFKRRTVPEGLRNVIIERAMAKVKLQNISLKKITNENLNVIPKPVWSEKDAEKFWISIIQQLSTLNLYFLYFINKAANILVRASSAVINGDIDISILPNSSLTNSSPLLPANTVVPSSFFYTQDDLSMLAQKSYTSFDVLIRTLRESIDEYHEEYPAKMSLVSAWGCYFHIVSSIGTFCLMMSGTFALLQKSLTTNTHISSISSALRREILLVRYFYIAALYPDYNFAIAQSLIDSFQHYRQFVQYLIDSYESGQNFEPDLVRVLKDPLFRHDYHETNKFLGRLQNHFYPTFCEIDSYCKSKCSNSFDDNTRFLSPTLTFDLAFEWFQVYRGDKTCLSRRVNPLKKTLYVFLNALGKSLAHIFPSLKYTSYVDPCNVAFCKVGFVAPEFDPWNRPRYHSIAPMFMDLVKVIKFFENRLRICGYLADRTVQSKKFITKAPLGAPESWEYRDIVHLSVEKLPIKETQLKSLTNTVIQLSNYPLFDTLLRDPICTKLIQAEQERQRHALYNDSREYFPETGMLNHDFDGTKIVDQYIASEGERAELRDLLIEELREFNEHMNQCRLEITNAIHAAS